MTKKKTAVLIPCYNEAQTIEKVIGDFARELPDAAIYVYDNNSTDGTADIAMKAGAIVKKEPKQGKGNVVRAMFRDIEADCYIMVDGDDTYPAGFAEKFEKMILDGECDMAVGDRLSSTYFEENKRPFHGFGNVLVKNLVNKLFKANLHDIMTGARACNRDFAKSYPVVSRGFEIETEMTIFALDNNFSIAETPIEYQDRPEGSESKLDTYSDGVKVLGTIASLFRDIRPFAFFSCVAALLLLVGLCFFFPIVFEYLATDMVPKTPTLIVTTLVMTLSAVSFMMGVILSSARRNERRAFERDLTIIRLLAPANRNLEGDHED